MQREPTILVVTSEPVICELLYETLREFGYNVVTAANVGRVAAVLPMVAPNLVLLDTHYPGDSLSACRRLLQEYCLDVPIVLLTTANSAGHASLPEGAAAQMRLPFVLGDLLTCVSCWLCGRPGPVACPVGVEAVHCGKKEIAVGWSA
ncbi:MAG: response regulator [Chloroflexaceae bacterium]|jgi:CheY-like chemotaxis protein|nr:response regulator [Chloroflexaceae bacterium]